jgi:hypothetical protein
MTLATAPVSSEAAHLISGDALKTAALAFIGEMRAKVGHEQGGLPSIFDSWFTRVVTRLINFDPARSWEDSVRDHAARSPAQDQSLPWDLLRLRLFLDRWRQGRFVEFAQRERSGVHYHPRFGTEFGVDVLLTCQGAPSLMRWRGMPLMKNVFDFCTRRCSPSFAHARCSRSDPAEAPAPHGSPIVLRSAASKRASIRSIWSRSRWNTRASAFIAATASNPS